MPETNSQTKDKIIGEFETMKGFELSARDLYTRIAADSSLGPRKIKTAFESLAADEQRHADLVQEIINIVANVM